MAAKKRKSAPKAPPRTAGAQPEAAPQGRPQNYPQGAPLNHAEPAALPVILADVAEKITPLMADFMGRIDWHAHKPLIDPANIQKSYIAFFQKLYEDPDRVSEMQIGYMRDWMTLWQESAKRFLGQPGEKLHDPEKGDKRFKSGQWDESAFFDFLKRSYLLTSRWINKSVQETQGLDSETQRKVEFFTRQFVDAMSPTNFLLTNPDVIQATLDSKGDNLLKGFRNMMEDLERGKGQLKISTTDYSAFEPGRNIAATPGQVVFQNDLIQLLQYEPTTGKVRKTPLLIVPPWINKFYILDLRPENSFIKWAVDQGHTVFVISWVNPDVKLSRKTFGDYMHEGILAALDAIETATGETQTNVIGYCIGGTLLATTLAWLAANGQKSKIASATFLTTLIDFRNSGDLQIFVDEEQLRTLEKSMSEKGMFDSRMLKDTFSLLRANDLIWNFVVNNYLLGKEPFPFDLLYWNDDSTNMPAAMQGFYLRNMYLENRLVQPGGIVIDGIPIDIRSIETPAYFLSTKEDHIAPWQATYAATPLFKGPVNFTLSGSGHVAGVINPPSANKYGYWTVTPGTDHPKDPNAWFAEATQHEGSWWTDWNDWIKAFSNGETAARQPSKKLEAAPGSYVKAKAS